MRIMPATFKSGTFTGDRTINATLNIGFEPDAVIIIRDLRTDVIGLQNIVFLKDRYTYNAVMYLSTSSGIRIGENTNPIAVGEDSWGYKESLGTYLSYGSYSNGVFTVTNKTNGSRAYFIDGEQYTWVAYRL